MLILLFLFVTIIFMIITAVALDNGNPISEILGGVSIVCFIIGCIAFVSSVLVACTEHLGIEGKVAAYQEHYDSLVYQLENNLYDNDLGKKELYDDITAWNTDLAEKKALQRDFWLGCFYPNIYDDFEFIELQ